MKNNNINPNTALTIKHFKWAIAWFIIVLILICIPGKEIPHVGSWFSKLSVDKFIHTGLFTVLAFLFMLPFTNTNLSPQQKWKYCIKIALATSVWGLCTELIQKYFIPGRSYDIIDWLADSLGAIIALICYKIIFNKKII